MELLTLPDQYRIGRAHLRYRRLPPDQLEDILQEAILYLWRSRRDFGRTYFRQCLDWTANTYRRRWYNRSTVPLDEDMELSSSALGPEQLALLKETVEEIDHKWPGMANLLAYVPEGKVGLGKKVTNFRYRHKKELGELWQLQNGTGGSSY
jgi:hypothetical protein